VRIDQHKEQSKRNPDSLQGEREEKSPQIVKKTEILPGEEKKRTESVLAEKGKEALN